MTRTRTFTIGLYLLGIFLLDLITPLGLPVWLLYGLPFFFLTETASRNHVYALGGVCIVLVHLGYLLSPAGHLEPLNNRYTATVVLSVMVLVLSRRRR
jgi:hypothetical protein